jgi:hypothetical protein
MTKQYLIIPIDPTRRAAWLDLLGRDRLPILRPIPRPGALGLVYDVDLAQLPAGALARLASYQARQSGEDYTAVYDRMRIEGAAVPAVGCAVIDDETAVSTAPAGADQVGAAEQQALI